MKRTALYLILIGLTLIPIRIAATDATLKNTVVKVYFSPDGGASKAITRQIDQAVREVLVQSYVMTSKPIESALVNAYRRGVEVEVIFDRNEQKERKYVTSKRLKARGIQVWLDDRHALSHNKIIISDRETVITGSFNFTYAAEARNAENLLIIPSVELAGLYTDNFLAHRRHSAKY